jgi:hypothetical protein
MNSEQIKKCSPSLPGYVDLIECPRNEMWKLFWLKEIAYQLAVMNEHKELELQRQSEALNS